MAVKPILNIKLIGEESTTVLNKSITWTPSSKIESTYSITSTDGAKTISFSNVSPIKTIVFDGTGSFIVSITTTTGGISPTYATIAFETTDVFVFSPTPVFANSLYAITVATTSTSLVTVEARIYGGV